MTKEEVNLKMGQRIVDLRKEKGWTQSDLARACDKDRQTIERLEKGRVTPTLYSLVEISRAMDIPLRVLVDFD